MILWKSLFPTCHLDYHQAHFLFYFCCSPSIFVEKATTPISLHTDYKECLRMDHLKCYGKHKNKDWSSKQLLKYFVCRTISFIGFISVLVEAVFNLLQMLKSCSRKKELYSQEFRTWTSTLNKICMRN